MTVRATKFLLPLLVLVFACARVSAIEVVASILPVHSLVSSVTSGVAEPVLLTKPDASPHTQTLRPSTRSALENADIVFWIGEALEPALARFLTDVQLAEQVALINEADITLRSPRAMTPSLASVQGSQGEALDPLKADPHIWLEPANARVMTTAIVQALVRLDPENALTYVSNADSTLADIRALEFELERTLAPVAGRPYIVYHDAYQGFEARFGMQALMAVSIDDQRAPGTRRVSELRELLERGEVRCLFLESGHRPRLADTLVEGTGVAIATLDPLGRMLEPGPGQWFAMMRGLAANLSGCLK